jgi:Peptidase M50B-like
VTMASMVAASIDRIGHIQSHLSFAASVLTAIIALGAVMIPALWVVTRHLQVMAHEVAHATVGSALGVKINGIELKLNGDGGTFPGPRGKGADFLATLAGYLGPSAFGIGAAALIKSGHIVAVLWIGVAGLIAILCLLRKSFGIVTVSVALLLLFGVAGFSSVSTQVRTAYALAWFLLASGIRIIMIRGKGSSDAAALAQLTKIPRGFWFLVWLAGTIAGFLFGATLLV